MKKLVSKINSFLFPIRTLNYILIKITFIRIFIVKNAIKKALSFAKVLLKIEFRIPNEFF